MKRILFILLTVFATQFAFATQYNIVISGFTYSPDSLNAVVGDTINIQASGNHPLVQVDSTNWANGVNTPMVGGWGVQPATYQLIVSAPGVIYFMCQIHGPSMGMKGKIYVTGGTTGVNELATAAPEVKLFPTLVKEGSVNVSLNNVKGAANLSVYNMAGQLVATRVLDKNLTVVDVILPAGLYVYTVSKAANNAVLKTGKFVISQ